MYTENPDVALNSCVSSIGHDDGCGEMDGAEEEACSFVVSGADGAEGFELGEEILDEVAGAMEAGIVLSPRPIAPVA